MRYDIFLTNKYSQNSPYLHQIFTPDELEEMEDESLYVEQPIAKAVSAVEVRHISANLVKNNIPFEVRETESKNGDRDYFNSKNTALWSSLRSHENYTLTPIDGLFITLLAIFLLLLIINTAYFEKKSHYELHTAVQRDQPGIIRILLYQNPQNVNQRDKRGRTPIFYLSGNKALSIAELLISKGADTEVTDIYGKTPLYYIERADLKDKQMIMYLLEHQAPRIRADSKRASSP